MDPISNLIMTLHNLGFYKFIIPFILTSAIFYGLLRKSKVFGDPKENVAVNASVAVSAAFLVSSAPIIAGIDITQYLSGFLIYVMFVLIATIVIFFIPFIVSPSLKEFGKEMNRKNFLVVFFLILSIFIAIGLIIFRNFVNIISVNIGIEEVYSSIALLVFLFIFSLIIYYTLKPSTSK